MRRCSCGGWPAWRWCGTACIAAHTCCACWPCWACRPGCRATHCAAAMVLQLPAYHSAVPVSRVFCHGRCRGAGPVVPAGPLCMHRCLMGRNAPCFNGAYAPPASTACGTCGWQVRLCGPATHALPPCCDMPPALRAVVGGCTFLAAGEGRSLAYSPGGLLPVCLHSCRLPCRPPGSTCSFSEPFSEPAS